MTEQQLQEKYIEWVVNQDCPYTVLHGADDGSLLAYEDAWGWGEFILDRFHKLGMSASYHFADDSCKEWGLAYRDQGYAMSLYHQYPELQSKMRELAKDFLWSFSLSLKENQN